MTVSRNFIVKQGTYSFVICRQSQARMKLIKAVDVHNATNYHIKVIAPNVDDFKIFIHSGNFNCMTSIEINGIFRRHRSI